MVERAAVEIFKDRLRAAREQRGYSQAQLAEKTGLPPSSISHFEAGARKPSFDSLKRLATALDVTTDFLLGRVAHMDAVGAADTIHRHLANLSSHDLRLADQLIGLLAQRNASPQKKGDE